MQLEQLSVKDLLKLQSSVIDELNNRGIVRTKNNPLGDYTEWLVGSALNLELQPNSKAGYDGVDKSGTRIQIKGRRVTRNNKSRQLSAIRKYEEKDFDILIGLIFNEDFEVIEALSIPHEVIKDYARFSSHSNAHLLTLKGAVLDDCRVSSLLHLFGS